MERKNVGVHTSKMSKVKFPSLIGILSQRQLYDLLTDPTLFEKKRNISKIQEPIILEIENQTARQYLELQSALLKLPL